MQVETVTLDGQGGPVGTVVAGAVPVVLCVAGRRPFRQSSRAAGPEAVTYPPVRDNMRTLLSCQGEVAQGGPVDAGTERTTAG